MRFHGIAGATAAAALALAACSQSRPGPTGAAAAVTVSRGGPAGGTVSVSPEGCTRCHGDMARAGADADPLAVAAPPRTPSGLDTDPAIGAHRKHLEAGAFWRPVECASCHVLPAAAESHVRQEQGKVTFSLMARASWGAGAAASPTWDGAGCASTYCHGSFPNGAGSNPISWNAAPGSAGCGSCHGLPPAGSHPGVSPTTSCASCHEGYDGMPGGPIVLSGAALQNHLNGRLDASGGHPAGWKEPAQHGLAAIDSSRGGLGACQACHVAFGAAGGAPSSCNGCHASPATYGPYTSGTYPNHAAWQTECTFCHGGRSGDTQGAPPRTTRVVSSDATTPQTTSDPAIGAHRQHLGGTSLRASPIACAECHAVPADLSHAGGAGTGGARALLTWGSLARGASSGAPVSPAYAGSTTAAGGATAGSCSATWCHGNIPNGAGQNPISWTASSSAAACGTCHGLPPAGTHPSLAAGTACSGCHPGYTGTAGGTSWAVNTALHLNGAVDAAGNHPAGWKEPAQHGLSAIDVSLGGLSACTACHTGFGPAGGAQSSCNGCHASPATYGPYTSGTYPNHANWQTECTFCHGGRGGDTQGAPPRNTHVVSSDTATPQPTTDVTIGAHASHVQAAHAVAQRLACTDCHPSTYASATDAGHVDAATASVIAGLGWTRTPSASAGCATAACHGSTLAAASRGSASAPVWTRVDGTQAACGACHAAPPGSANHHNAAAVTACSRCHSGTVDAGGAILVAGGKHINGAVDTANLTCTTCHGNGSLTPSGTQDANVAAAPTGAGAPDTYGNTTAAARGVGVHASHVLGTRSRAMACNACHAVPATPIHKTGIATAGAVALANLAVAGGITTASYSTTALTCASTYCHGNFAGGAGPASTTPAWTAAGTLACSSCHGDPPALSLHHPQNAACAACHGAGYSSSAVAAATHVDGTVQKPAAGCTACHGVLAGPTGPAVAATDPSSAPGYTAAAVDSTGALSGAAVGAHQKHLAGTTLRASPIACAECHALPAVGDTSHATGAGTGGARATLTWGSLARGASSGAPVSPAYAGSTTAAGGATAGSCSATWCHGNIPNGAGQNPISWTASSSAAACGTCHGLPPAGTHPSLAAGTACSGCHPGYTGTAGGTSWAVNTALHLNGAVDAAGNHPAGWKEPAQHGLSAIDVSLGGLSACTACHTGFGPAGGAQSSCNGCHASPATYGPYTSGTYPNHANWQTECTFCHGGRGGDTQGAPPRNTHVVSSDTATPQPTTDVTIGAHASHVQAAHAIAQTLACGACHPGPYTNVTTDVGHVDKATADVSFAAVGATANPGTYARPTCASNYCHGNFTGGSSASLAWTGTFGATFTLTCTSCHGSPPGPVSATVHHPQSPACGDCHPGYGSTTVAATTHVDGTVQKPSGCTACHGELNPAVAAQPVASGSLSAAPGYGATPTSKDSHGNTATASRGVGVHNLHLAGTRSRPVACGECHTVPVAGDVAHANGTAQVTFAATLANKSGGAAYSAAALTCSATYCHGNFAGGAGPASTTPAWTAAGTLACTACHGNPPPASSGHPQNTSCASCHGSGYSTTTVNAATHVDGTVNLVAAESCTSCHGTPGRASVAGADANQAAAPPNDTLGNSAATAAGVGAHLAHVNQSRAVPFSKPFSCATCHPVPTSNLHGNGTSQVTFTGIAVTGSIANASYARPSCTATYCHGNFVGGSGTAAPAWNASGAQLACTACHGAPPGPVSASVHHPQNPNCQACHPGYTASTVAAATHVDGTVQKPTGCTACHGDLTAAGVANTDVRAAPAANANAVDTRGNAATATAQRGIGAHQKHLTGTAWRSTPIACSECHAVPAAGDETHVSGTPVVTFGALARTAWAGQPAIAPVWNGAGGATTLTCASTYCHGNFKNGANSTPTWATPSAVACGSCHAVSAVDGPGGTHPVLTAGQSCGTCHGGSYTNTSVDPVLHLNGQLDGGGESSGGSACGGCHSATFSAMNGGTPKAFKHALGAVAGTNDSPSVGTADWTLAANLQGAVAPSGRSCANMCHADHVHTNVGGGATHEYNVYLDAGTAATRGATASATTRDNTDFDSAATNGGLCVSCHTRPIDATAGRITVTKASFAGTGHDYVQNTVGATTYTWSFAMHDGGVFQRNCTKCHAGGAGEDQASVSGTALGAVHYSDNDSLLMGSSVPAGGTASVSTFVCYKCHGTATAGTTFPMNRSGVDVYLEAQKAQGHGGAATAAIANLNNDSHHSSLAEASAAFGGTLYSGAGRHVSCLDCHDPHESGKTSRNYAAAGAATRNQIPAGSPLTGASGIQYGTAGGAGKSYPALPASGSWPATAAANYGNATVRATYEYEICFKCHTGFAFGSTPPAATATPSALAETDLGLEFSPTLRSGHPVVSPLNSYTGNTAPKALVAAQLAAPFNTAMGTQTMTCTDCHFGDAASPAAQGPHGSAVKFMLRGPNQTWPGTFTLATSGASAYNAGAGTPAGLFCLNCHPMRTGTTWANNAHARSNHSSRACVACHILVPHGGKVSRLIAAKGTGTSTLPARYDGGSAVTQFRKAASPTGYDTPNCNTSCGGHGTVTTPETW